MTRCPFTFWKASVRSDQEDMAFLRDMSQVPNTCEAMLHANSGGFGVLLVGRRAEASIVSFSCPRVLLGFLGFRASEQCRDASLCHHGLSLLLSAIRTLRRRATKNLRVLAISNFTEWLRALTALIQLWRIRDMSAVAVRGRSRVRCTLSAHSLAVQRAVTVVEAS